MRVDVAFTIADVPDPVPDGVHAIVIDVVRAMSVVAHALKHGAAGVRPVADVAEARERAAASGALLGGERGGLALEGFDLGNSPGHYDAARCAGRGVILTTSNGTRAVEAVTSAASIWGAGFVNAEATVRGVLAERGGVAACERAVGDELVAGDVLIVCAGSGDRAAADDIAAAGCLVGSFALLGGASGTDAARTAVALFDTWRSDLLGLARRSLSGRKLATIGLGADLELCATVDTLPVAARLDDDGVFRQVSLGP